MALWTLLRRLRALFLRGYLDRDLEDELAFHLAMRQDDDIRAGTSPTEAQLNSRRRFGNVLQTREQSRDAWVFAWLESVLQDVRFALRGLRRTPGFAAVALVTLALGIGGSTAIFSVVNAALLRPLPYRDAHRLVRIVETVPPEESPSGQALRTTAMTEDAYLWWRDHATTLPHVEAILASSMIAEVSGVTVRVPAARVSPSLFATLGTSPVIGRVLNPTDEHANVAVLSVAAWRRLFSSDPGAVGKTIVLDGVPHTLIGIADSAFGIPSVDTEVWTPYVAQPLPNRRVTVDVLAKLRDGVSFEAASVEVGALGHRLLGDSPSDGTKEVPSADRFGVIGLQDHLVAPVRPALRVLLASVLLVLLNVCANIANLLTARSLARERELAIRQALGAGRGRIIRQLLTEGVVLSAIGGGAGIGVAFGGVRLVKALTAITLPLLYGGNQTLVPGIERLAIDGSVLTFALVASATTGLLFAALPLVQFSLPQAVAMRNPMIGPGVTRTGSGIRLVLAVAQVAMATILMIGAGLLTRSFVVLANVDLGYRPGSTLTFELILPEHLLDARKLAIADELANRLSSMGKVSAAGFTSAAPLSTLNGGWALTPPGVSPGELLNRPELRVGASSVSPDYLRAIGVGLLEGRWLNSDHGVDQPPALLVNRVLARRFFGEAAALGRSVNLGGREWHVVGVVEDIRSKGLDQDPEPRAYLDHDRFVADARDAGWDKVVPVPAPRFLSFAVRVEGEPATFVPAVHQIVRALEPLAVVDGAVGMDDVVSGALLRPRFYAVLVGFFAVVALVIAVIGIYGVLSYGVTQGTQEIGIRIALGAKVQQVLTLVLRRGLLMTVTGIALGLAGAVATTRFLEAMLFGVTPLDRWTFVGVAAVFAAVSALACYIPARRATKVDPLVALRCE